MRLSGRTANYISTRIGRAIADYKLIEDKDRILVGVSGGKDSLALLQLLNERRKWAPVDYKLIAMHVETDYDCAAADGRKRLKKFFEKLGVEGLFKKIRIRDTSGKEPQTCFWCSWNRRKALFMAADKLGCNKVALGHTMDDIIQTLLLNLFYQGEFAAMNPRQELFKGKIVIVRPLCYVEEGFTRKYAKDESLPVDPSRCATAEASKRKFMKDLIAKVEKDCPHVKTNLFKSISRINREYLQILGNSSKFDE